MHTIRDNKGHPLLGKGPINTHSWDGFALRLHVCVEEGSNTSTLALQVAGSDEMGRLESGTVKYGSESHGTQTPE
jgi:hypothetical protein